MKDDSTNSEESSSQKPMIAAAVFAVAAAVIYMFMVSPAEADLKKLQSEFDSAETKADGIDRAVKTAKIEKEPLAAAEERIKEYSKYMLERRLGSYATHARDLLERLAGESGLSDVDYPETYSRRLPMPNPANSASPEQLHERVAVRMTAHGSYQAAVSFILRAECELPLVSVLALKIASNGRDQFKQQIEITFEWPARGEFTAQTAQKARAK